MLIALCPMASADRSPHAPIEIKDDWSFNSINGVSGGDGTEGNPYVIENWEITNASGIYIKNTGAHFVIRNVTLQSDYTDINMGIWFYYVSNGDIENVSVTRYGLGIEMMYCSHVTVSDTVLEGSGAFGLLSLFCTEMRLINVTVSGTSSGIRLMGCENCLLGLCTSTDNTAAGIELGWQGSSGDVNVTLVGCVAKRNPTGIYLSFGSAIVVRDCVAEDNTELDLSVWSAPTTIDGNRLGKAGLELLAPAYLQNVSGTNTVGGDPLVFLVNRSNLRVGGPAGQVFLSGCDNVTLDGLSFDGVREPITVSDCTGTHIVDCTVSGAYVGLGLLYRGDANVTGCTFDGTAGAFGHLVSVYIDRCTVTFRDCSFSGGDSAIIAQSDRPLSVVNTTFQGLKEGINVSQVTGGSGDYEGGNLIVEGSRFLDCGVGMLLYGWDVEVNGTVCERSALAGLMAQGCDLTVLDTRFEIGPYGIYAEHCPTVYVEGCEFAGPGGTGVLFYYIQGRIVGCTFDRCEHGISLGPCDDFIVTGCVFKDIIENGVYIEWSTGCEVDGRFVGCGVGMQLYISNGCTITRSHFEACGEGLLIEACQDITVLECDFERSTGYALNISDESSVCNVYHNVLKQNNYNTGTGAYRGAQASDASSANTWDDGEEGNFWEDMQARYPDAKPLGRVWDTPYVLTGGLGASDRFPLTLAVDTISPTAVMGSDRTVDWNATFELNGSASTDDLGIVSYEWSLFDGVRDVRLEGPVVQLAIARLGTFKITLTVKDAWGNADHGTLNITVVDREPPVAIAGDDVMVEVGLPAVLNATRSSDNVAIAGFAWTVDPGGLDRRLLGPVVAVTLPVMGDYMAILNVTDTSGNWAIDEVVIHVTDLTPPVAVAGPDVEVDQGTLVTFDGSLSNDNLGIARWAWSFDYRGTPVTLEGARPGFTFDLPGVYVVLLTVTDGVGNADGTSMTVTVRDRESPRADAGADVTVDPGVEVTLSGAASTDNGLIADFLWTVPRGATIYEAHGTKVTVSFPVAGTYSVKLKVTDAGGNWATDTVTVLVRDVTAPTADAGGDVIVDQGATVTLDGGGSQDDVGVALYVWTFEESGMPVRLDGRVVSHAFNALGVFTVTLRVEDAAGNQATDMLNVTVLSREVPWAFGPFLDKDGNRVHDVKVTVILNGTIYSGTTDATGWIVPTVKRHDIVSPASVTASKKGYRTATFTLRLDKDGRPLDTIPRLERDQKTEGVTPGSSTVATVAAIAAVASLCTLMERRRSRPAS
jgi:hypothetical protein